MTIFVILFAFSVSADERFCLEEEGFVYPLFDEKNCANSNDESITKQEFINIINFEKEIRKAKLEEFRKNIENQEIKTEKDIKVADVEKIKKESLQKIKNNKKKQERLARIEKRKKAQEQKRKNFLAKIEERKKIQKQKKLAKLEKNKRLQEQKKQKKLAKLEEKKRLQEQKKQKKLAKLEEKKRLKDLKKFLQEQKKQKKLAKSEYENFNEESKSSSDETFTVNENLKVTLLDKKIVKSNLIPYLSGEVSILNELNKQSFKELIKTNTNLVLIIPKDFESFSNNVSQNQMTSRVVSGIQQIPNPDYRRLEMEIRDAEHKALMAKRESEIYEHKLATQQSSGVGWLDVLGAFANTAGSISYHNTYVNLQNKLSDLISEYSSTPMYIDKEIFSPYNYDVINVKSEKKAHYNVIQYKNKTFYKSNVSFGEEKNFKVAYNIQPQDKRYQELTKKFDTMDNVKNWENRKLQDVSIDNFLVKLENSERNQINGLNDVYALLNYEQDEEKSFWKKLLGFDKKKKNKKKKIVSLSNSSYEIKDERFNSVVLIKTKSGLGSGFFISKDEVLTNYHVIEGATNISIIDQNKKRSSAVVMKTDLKRDLALLKTNMKGKPVDFYSGQLKQGTDVEALGHPKGFKFSLTKGSVSAIRLWSSGYSVTDNNNVLFIQTDAAINHGNSGGPLFFKNKVVGVNTQGLNKDSTEGMNFAVHFSEVQKFLSE